MKLQQRAVLAALAPGLVLGAWVALTAAMVWATLSIGIRHAGSLEP